MKWHEYILLSTVTMLNIYYIHMRAQKESNSNKCFFFNYYCVRFSLELVSRGWFGSSSSTSAAAAAASVCNAFPAGVFPTQLPPPHHTHPPSTHSPPVIRTPAARSPPIFTDPLDITCARYAYHMYTCITFRQTYTDFMNLFKMQIIRVDYGKLFIQPTIYHNQASFRDLLRT